MRRAHFALCATRRPSCRPPPIAHVNSLRTIPSRKQHTLINQRQEPIEIEHYSFRRLSRPPSLSGRGYRFSGAPLLLLAAAAMYSAEDDDEDGEEDDNDDTDNELDSDDYILEDPEPVSRPRYMRLRDAKRWVRHYADHHDPSQLVEAFVPLVLDVQERVMDVANVEITDFADFYFLAGFFASVLTDIPVKEQLSYLERLSEELSRFPERQQAARMVLIYTALLTKEPELVRWFKTNATNRLAREPKFVAQPERIKKQISILLHDIEQQLNENWAIVAAGHFIASRSTGLLRDIVEALDTLVHAAQGRIPADAVEEVIAKTIDVRGVAVRAYSRMDLSERSPEVRRPIEEVVRAAGLKMRPPRRRKKARDEEDDEE